MVLLAPSVHNTAIVMCRKLVTDSVYKEDIRAQIVGCVRSWSGLYEYNNYFSKEVVIGTVPASITVTDMQTLRLFFQLIRTYGRFVSNGFLLTAMVETRTFTAVHDGLQFTFARRVHPVQIVVGLMPKWRKNMQCVANLSRFSNMKLKMGRIEKIIFIVGECFNCKKCFCMASSSHEGYDKNWWNIYLD